MLADERDVLMDYKDTVNLPKTSFPMKASLGKLDAGNGSVASRSGVASKHEALGTCSALRGHGVRVERGKALSRSSTGDLLHRR